MLAENGRRVDLPYTDIEIVQVSFASQHDPYSASFNCPALVLHMAGGKRYAVPLTQSDIEKCWLMLQARCPRAGMLWGFDEVAPEQHGAVPQALRRMARVRLATGRLGLIISGGVVLNGLMRLFMGGFAAPGAWWWAEVLGLPAGVLGVIVSWRSLKKGRLLHLAGQRAEDRDPPSET